MENNCLTNDDVNSLLNLFENHAIINTDMRNKVAELIEQMNKKQVIEKHPYEVYTITRKGKTYFVTYVTDETKANHRRQISATTKENLENKIYIEYQKKTLFTFEKISWAWLRYYKNTVKDTTFDRTMSDYKRFIPSCPFAKKSIAKIKPFEIKEYLQTIILQEKLKKRAYSNLKSMLNGIFRYALEKEYITNNPMQNLSVSTANLEQSEKKTKEEEVFTNKEKDLLRDFIKEDCSNFKNTVPYAILLSFQLGLRVGELIALKWTDVSENAIHIQRQEVIVNKYDEDLNVIESAVHEVREYTKTQAGKRLLPLTPEAKEILTSVRIWNEEHQLVNDFIFVDDYGVNYNRQRINTCLYNYCMKVGIIKKSSHKIRRSVISNLLDNITNKVAVKDFAGHENLQTTLNSYYKNISDDTELYDGMCACL